MKRRNILLSSVAAVSSLGLPAVHAQDSCAVFTPQSQGALSPQQVLDRLKAGNERFVSGKGIQCDLMKQVKDTSKGQAPIASIVGCIDSRVPPEMVFDQRIGDIFAARIAGNFVNDDIIGSLEFTTKLAGARAIVVLGHSECGAVKGAVDDAKMGLLTGVLAQIRPSLEKLKYQGVPSSKDKVLVQRVAEQNVLDAVARLSSRSAVLADLVKEGKLVIAGAVHNLETGRIQWLS